jgi:hypothetical protein
MSVSRNAFPGYLRGGVAAHRAFFAARAVGLHYRYERLAASLNFGLVRQ